jgi:hypothetical protein
MFSMFGIGPAMAKDTGISTSASSQKRQCLTGGDSGGRRCGAGDARGRGLAEAEIADRQGDQQRQRSERHIGPAPAPKCYEPGGHRLADQTERAGTRHGDAQCQALMNLEPLVDAARPGHRQGAQPQYALGAPEHIEKRQRPVGQRERHE